MKKLLFVFLFPFLLCADKPNLLLLKTYNQNLNVTGWLMSEKLDGVRAFWTGKKLISRNGKEFMAPKWFTKDFPPFAIDGELWSKRDDFERISSITSKSKPHEGWREITYNIFEVPKQSGGLLARVKVLQRYLKKQPHQYIRIIKQIECKDTKHLKTFLKEIQSKGGEGVVVRNPLALYIDKRTKEALKVKSFEDTECKVIGYKEGKGKYTGQVGALKCELDSGKHFFIGSGLSDRQRKTPPKIGSLITFKYQGFTKKGKPRFPVFLRQRPKKE